MKIRLTLFFLSVFFTSSISAQWTWRNPLPQGNDLYIIKMKSDHSIWAAGNTGTIIHSTDGGVTWQVENLIKYTKWTEFTGLDFPEDSVGYAVDAIGYIYKTSDGGATWDSIYWETEEFLQASCFTDKLNGVIVCSGSKIIRTTDGGMSWIPWYFNKPVSFRDVSLPSPLVGYAAGGEYILKSSDGGNSWTEVYFDSTADLITVKFTSDTHGFAAGDNGLLLTTIDGGTSWSSQALCDTTYFYSIGQFSPDTLILNGFSWMGSPVKYRTTNGGITWDRLLPAGDSQPTLSIIAQSGGTAYTAGYHGFLQKTMDYGDSWISLSACLGNPIYYGSGIYGIDFPTVNTGYAVKGGLEVPIGKILKTTDKGETWNELDTAFQYQTFWAVDFTNENIGCIGGSGIYNTMDGGQNWVYRTSGSGEIRSISFASTQVCVAVGHNGAFLRSADCGQSWTNVSGIPELDYYAVKFADQNIGYAAGSGGSLLKTTDAGVTWTAITIGYNLLALHFTSPEKGFGVGPDGLIIRTLDGGETWQQVGVPREEHLYAVDFYDADTGYVVGGLECIYAIVLKTTDGGTTWKEQVIPTYCPLYAVATTGSDAITGGYTCNLFGTTNGGISVSAGPEVRLSEPFIHVYPNPASSNITIDTPEPGMLSVFTFSGEELLIRQISGPKVTIDISGFSKGAYIVKVVGRTGTRIGKFIKQ